MAGPTKAWALRRTAQVAACDVRDRLLVRTSHGSARIPLTATDITSDWLTEVLCPDGAHVTSLSVVDASTGTTTRQALALRYDDAGDAAGLPRRVFVKSTTGFTQRLMLGLGGLIHGEPRFYAHVAPVLPIETPACYFAAVDGRSWRSVLILEDVHHTRGASFVHPGLRLGRAQLEELLGSLARWHGRLWDSPHLRAWRWLRTPADQMSVIDALIGMADRTRAGARRAGETIPAVLRSRREDLLAALRRSMGLASLGPRTYLHGDLHVANTYLTAEGTVGVCDWQCGLQGSWSYDYAYIMATAPEVDDRRAWERELLTHYLECLTEAGGAAIAPDQAWLSYRQSMFYPYFAWLYTLGRSRLQPDFQHEDISRTLVPRIAAAIDDLDSFGAVGI